MSTTTTPFPLRLLRALASAADVIAQVLAKPGAVGYIDASALRNGHNVIARP